MSGYTPDAKLFQDNWNLPDNPFPFLGADQYPDEQVLSLFEIDRDTTIRAFSLQNTIIEGSFGTGKTMLLKAIYAYHYSKMIVDIAEKKKAAVVPVYIKFSDLPYGSQNVYKELILSILKKTLDTRFLITSFLKDESWFNRFKFWLDRLTKTGIFAEDKRYSELSSESVTKRVKEIFKSDGCIGFDWIKKLSIDYENIYEKELINKPNPGIVDIENIFQSSFSGICDKLLILIDEVDRLPTNAFSKENGSEYSVYETIFNQLRTSNFLLYKVAVYPNTDSSNQVEGSRIGTRVKLGFNTKDANEFIAARDFFYRILKSYLSFCATSDVDPTRFFKIQFVDNPEDYPHRVKRVDEEKYGDALEQLVFGSNGIVRRFIKLSGDSMIEALKKRRDTIIVTKYDVFDSMRSFGGELIERLQENERALVDRIAYFCITEKGYRFRVPGNEKFIYSLYDRTKQDNVIYPLLDQDRRGLNYIFDFDYCYCLYRNIPTHYFLNAEKVSLSRSVVNGKWIVKPIDIPKYIINLDAKIEGKIIKYEKTKGWGFISYLPNKDLFFHRVNVSSLGGKEISEGQLATYRLGRNYEGECAVDIELI
jgi:cold shock CspA family protein